MSVNLAFVINMPSMWS